MRFLILLNKKQLKKLDFLGTEPKKPTTVKKIISALLVKFADCHC